MSRWRRILEAMKARAERQAEPERRVKQLALLLLLMGMVNLVPAPSPENSLERAFQRLSDEDKLRVVALEQQRRLEAQQRQDPRCQGKRACKDMTTCEEARFYLTTCGLKRLDRDGDGVPCEKLCR